MGIRIYKTLGYGLTNVKTKKHKIIDKRINPQGYLMSYEDYEDCEDRWTLPKYAEWLKREANNIDTMGVMGGDDKIVDNFEYKMEIQDVEAAISEHVNIYKF